MINRTGVRNREDNGSDNGNKKNNAIIDSDDDHNNNNDNNNNLSSAENSKRNSITKFSRSVGALWRFPGIPALLRSRCQAPVSSRIPPWPPRRPSPPPARLKAVKRKPGAQNSSRSITKAA